MRIEKLPSGSYRVRMTFNGKRHAVTFDHKPTEKEVMLKFSQKITAIIDCEHITFEVAANEYCKLKKNVLSPTTYREYINTTERLSDTFKNSYIDDIGDMQLQAEINTLSAKRKPKTVKNYYGFIVSVIRMYRNDFYPRIKLPAGEKNEMYIPTDEEVRMIFDYAQKKCNGRYYIPIILASFGMRRSEICALEPSDFNGNIASITKAKVYNSDKEWIIKNYPKNETSIRNIPIPEDIVEMIKSQGYVYSGHPNDITCFINDACNALNIKHFSIHKLRHYFCSRLASENIDTETIMALGGWKSDFVLKNIYRHKIDSKVQEASDKLAGILFDQNEPARCDQS